MRKLLLCALILAVLGAIPVAHSVPEGCIAANAAVMGGDLLDAPTSCTYKAAVPGNIVGLGYWTVQVWWSGTCDIGPANWVRSTLGGDNNAARLGLWEGSISPGSCARATAHAAGSVVAIGEIRP